MTMRHSVGRAAAALLISISATALVAPPLTAHAADQVTAKPACTKTSSGTCIKGGQFCPQSSYGKSGYDAAGRRWVCKGDHTHPHWLKP